MRLFLFPLCLCCAAAFAADATAPAPKPTLRMSVDECAVWNRERSFAASVDAHDAAAFAEHVQQDAAFGPGTAAPTRGRAAIATEWKDIIAGKGIALHWYPQVVAIGGTAAVAFSSGNYWMEDKSPDTRQRYLRGRFTSVWTKDSDGQWRVEHDGGGMAPIAATQAEVDKLQASFQGECPR